METKEDPDLAQKATEMRSQGLSWSDIASNLGIGRTTARRLVKQYRGVHFRPMASGAENIPSNGIISCDSDENEVKNETSINQSQDDKFPLNDNVLNMMPKTFQIFNSLLEKARQKQGK